MTAPPLVQAADELLGFLRANGRSACLIGGIVVSRWGEPRATKDVDATVLVDFKEEAAVLDLLLSKFESRDPISRMGGRLDAARVRLWGGRFAEILEKPEFLDPFEAALRKPGRLP